MYLKLKKEEHAEKGYPPDDKFYHWDLFYFDKRFTELSLDFDEDLVMKYFPVSFTIPRIIEIYQDLLSIEFVKIEGGTSWHEGNVSVEGFNLVPLMLNIPFRRPAIFCLEEGCQETGRFHWILLSRFVHEE